jgi:hypothetical protein
LNKKITIVSNAGPSPLNWSKWLNQSVASNKSAAIVGFLEAKKG